MIIRTIITYWYLLVFAIAPLLSVSQIHAGQIWESDILLDGTDRHVCGEGMGIDSSGNPHIISSGDNLYHTWFDGQNWLEETVVTPAQPVSSANVGIGPDGTIHIIYYSDHDVVHACRQGSNWDFSFLGKVSVCSPCNARFDSGGNLHTAFISNGGTLIHAVRDNGVWILSEIYKDASLYSPWGFDLDGSDDPHFCFWSTQSYTGLQYLYLNNSEWHMESTGSHISAVSRMTLSVDMMNNPRIVYITGYSTKYVACLSRQAGNWIGRFLSYIDYSSEVSFFVDVSNVAHVAVVSNKVLTHLFLQGDDWERESIDPGHRYYGDVSGISGRSGTIFIASCNNTYSHLTCFEGGAGQWSDYALAEFGGYGNCITAFDREGKLNTLFTGHNGNRLIYGCLGQDGWNFQVLEELMGADSGQCVIVADETGNIHISYYHYQDRTLYHAVKIGDQWQTEIVFEGPVVHDSDMIVSGDEDVSILLSTDVNLYLCRKNAGVWEREAFDPGKYGAVSLCTDNSGIPSFVYYRLYGGGYYSGPDLYYRYLDQGAWTEEAIPDYSAGSGYEPVSLYIDRLNTPKIIYGSFTFGPHSEENPNIRYGYRSPDGWHTEPFQGFYYGDRYHFSGRLDDQGNPCVAEGIMYYFYSDTGDKMRSKLCLDTGSTLCRRSLITDACGGIHLIHTVNSDLCYTRQSPQPAQGVRLEMPSDSFIRRDSIYLNAYLRNGGQRIEHMPLCILLEYQQSYWFWPEWTDQFNVEYVDVNERGSAVLPIPSTYYLDPLLQPLEDLTFWGALLNEEMTEILGGVDGIGMWEFNLY